MSSRPASAATRAGGGQGFLGRHLPTVHAWTGNLGWPILLKQLRTEFRRHRFFYSHLACLAVLGGTLLLIITTSATDLSVTPTQVGQSVFNWFFIIQFLVVLVIFPAFSTTAFTEERSSLSLDLLLITTLTPEEIVWGKFLASTMYCFLYIMATVPLLAISFLFGGVTAVDVLLSYAVLMGMTLLVSMMSLCLSSCFKANIRATFSVYVVVLLALLYTFFFVYADVKDVQAANPNQTILTAAESQWDFSGDTAWLKWSLLFMDLLGLFVLLFLITANRIRPPADDHTSKLRILALLYLPLRVIGGFYEKFGDAVIYGGAISQDEILSGMKGSIQFAFVFLLVLTVAFATEESDVSARCRKQYAAYTGLRYPLRLLAPGAFWGFWYSVLLASVVCGSLWGLFVQHFADLADLESVLFVRESLFTMPIYLAGFAALGFLLSVCAFTPLYSRLTVSFIFIITLLLPMIFYISEAPDRVYNGYYVSPLVLWDSLAFLENPPPSEEVQFRLGGIHIIDIAKGVFLCVCGSLAAVSVAVARRGGLPLLRFEERR